jgi:2'-5' RNA ligase
MTFDEQHQEVNKQILNLKPSDIKPLATYKIEPIYTLVAKPPEHVSKRIAKVTEELTRVSPEHYYYTAWQYHCTLMPLGDSKKDIDAKSKELRRIFSGNPIKVKVIGMAVNKHSAAVSLYPIGDNFIEIRNKIRELFGQVLDYSEHNQIWEQLMWIHVLRFTQTPTEKFLKLIYSLRDEFIGEYEISEWDLYKTSSKVLRPKDSTLVERFTTS